jgi:murein DD-endopeptidase MepM/ murein hydrolase activator NlpD
MTPTNSTPLASGIPNAAAGVPRDDIERSRAEVRRLAQEFEAVLLTQILKDMRRTMVDEQDDTPEFGAMTDTVDVEFGRTLSAAGGFGLSERLLQGLATLSGAGPAASPWQPAEIDSALRAVEPAGHVLAPEAMVGGAPTVPGGAVADAADLPGPITSGFGWRRDPLSGAPGFHAGVDVGMAYGREVRAVAGGRVTFAGERGGYGLMVTVAHGDGRETRYAHLASQDVREGDVVGADQILGRSGSSGRATGPHLHFEMLVDGVAVNPLRERVPR